MGLECIHCLLGHFGCIFTPTLLSHCLAWLYVSIGSTLQERDEAKTRKLAEARLSKEEREDLERRKYTTEEEKEGLLPQLRWASFMLLLHAQKKAKGPVVCRGKSCSPDVG